MLGWDQYQNLLDEIGSLIGEDGEQSRITGTAIGVALPIHSTQEVKILPKSSPR